LRPEHWSGLQQPAAPTHTPLLQVTLGMLRMNALMKICNKFMLRRTSTVLKSLLPAKVEQVCTCVVLTPPGLALACFALAFKVGLGLHASLAACCCILALQ
jgi:hypothetical protein